VINIKLMSKDIFEGDKVSLDKIVDAVMSCQNDETTMLVFEGKGNEFNELVPPIAGSIIVKKELTQSHFKILLSVPSVFMGSYYTWHEFPRDPVEKNLPDFKWNTSESVRLVVRNFFRQFAISLLVETCYSKDAYQKCRDLFGTEERLYHSHYRERYIKAEAEYKGKTQTICVIEEIDGKEFQVAYTSEGQLTKCLRDCPEFDPETGEPTWHRKIELSDGDPYAPFNRKTKPKSL
jgi:hypothetical protein